MIIEEICPTCNGTGIEFDEHPHNGCRLGDGYTCTRCNGSGNIDRLLTMDERISILEDKVKRLEARNR